MIKILKTVTPSPAQWEIIIEGMRNPMNSWGNSDSYKTVIENPETLNAADFEFFMGERDHARAMDLTNGGPVHAKYRRMIPVWVTINAPLYWWKEFETYHNGVVPNPTDIVLNSCSTMHKIHENKFCLNDFSNEHLDDVGVRELEKIIDVLNKNREKFLLTKNYNYWWTMIQLLPTSYNQRRTLMLNYEALSNMYYWRRNHKLNEWRDLCDWIETLPYSELITAKEDEDILMPTV